MTQVPLKDQLYNRDSVRALAGRLHSVDPQLRRDVFVEEVTGRLGELQLKERITWIAEVLERHLPNQYRDAVEVLLRSLPTPCDPTLSDGDVGDFTYAPYGECIARRGTGRQDVEFSLSAHKETQGLHPEEGSYSRWIKCHAYLSGSRNLSGHNPAALR